MHISKNKCSCQASSIPLVWVLQGMLQAPWERCLGPHDYFTLFPTPNTKSWRTNSLLPTSHRSLLLPHSLSSLLLLWTWSCPLLRRYLLRQEKGSSLPLLPNDLCTHSLVQRPQTLCKCTFIYGFGSMFSVIPLSCRLKLSLLECKFLAQKALLSKLWVPFSTMPCIQRPINTDDYDL